MFCRRSDLIRNTQKLRKVVRPRTKCHHHAVIVGCYKEESNGLGLTENGLLLQEATSKNFKELLSLSNFKGDIGNTRSFFGLHKDYPCITVTGLGDKEPLINPNEEIDQKKENIRVAVGAATKSLSSYNIENISVDSCGSATAAAEGAFLSTYVFDKYKSEKKKVINVDLFNFGNDNIDKVEWQNGMISAESQNFARELMETPSNYKYPALFTDMMLAEFSGNSNIDIFVRDENWAKEKKMGCFLSVGQGSVNKSAMLEIHYKGSDDMPIVLVGKGITFDSGGISIKPSSGMALMRGDMGGAACVLGTLKAVSKMRLPVNLIVLVALAENMPSGSATKPGDVFTAMNGKTVEVDNTDAEGRLVLADALCYADEFNPAYIINAATLTGAMDVALGAAATGTFTTCDSLWSRLHNAGISTGDRVWRMPVFDYYTKQMECSKTADLRNTQKKARSAGSCTAATFLKEFVTVNGWAHLDIAGVMENEGDIPYIGSGMSGRPTRTLIETVRGISEENS